MGIPPEQNEQFEALRGLIDRLSAPDLTLTEAKVLRERLTGLLDTGEPRRHQDAIAASPGDVPSSDRGDRPRPDRWSPAASMRAAG